MRSASKKKQATPNKTNRKVKAALQILIGSIKIETRIKRQKYVDYNGSNKKIGQAPYEEFQIVIVAPRREAEHTSRAKIRGYQRDRHRNCPHRPSAQEVVGRRGAFSIKKASEYGDKDNVT